MSHSVFAFATFTTKLYYRKDLVSHQRQTNVACVLAQEAGPLLDAQYRIQKAGALFNYFFPPG